MLLSCTCFYGLQVVPNIDPVRSERCPLLFLFPFLCLLPFGFPSSSSFSVLLLALLGSPLLPPLPSSFLCLVLFFLSSFFFSSSFPLSFPSLFSPLLSFLFFPPLLPFPLSFPPFLLFLFFSFLFLPFWSSLLFLFCPVCFPRSVPSPELSFVVLEVSNLLILPLLAVKLWIDLVLLTDLLLQWLVPDLWSTFLCGVVPILQATIQEVQAFHQVRLLRFSGLKALKDFNLLKDYL